MRNGECLTAEACGCGDEYGHCPRFQMGEHFAPARCVCAVHDDGSVTTFLCPVHADTDPCLTMASVTGRRRTGTIRRGVCTHCGHGAA